ncbi:DUF4391 domain-containing protein [Roseibacillus persicicus]|uniref:Methyl-accepting chemotaxis protein n=1 Tax=Roseibacillus persicicus TaxID=454148 RepID=A0A918TBC6_9BACT|nr:DUF4391 domain-containing protein [Roseibacillus persicicus]GHC41215.1 hypothetical protein GCM10007100_02360 [Roseibacillus persicicus]
MFICPPASLLNRKIAKAKFLANSHPSTRIRELLTSQVQDIIWHAKLSPESINLPATPAVAEIEVFHLALKGKDVHPDLLDFLDKSIPHPIIFRLKNIEGHLAYSAAYKRPSESELFGHVLGSRFSTPFTPQSSSPLVLPTALDLEKLYLILFEQLLPLSARSNEPLEALILRNKQHQLLSRQIQALQNKANREKQFNRRVALNQELNLLKDQLDTLQS